VTPPEARIVFVDARWSDEPPTAPEFDCGDCGVCCAGSPKVVDADLKVVPPGMVEANAKGELRLKTIDDGKVLKGHLVRSDGRVAFIQVFRLRARRCAAMLGSVCTLHGEYGENGGVDLRPAWCDAFPVGAWGCQAARYHAGLSVSPWFDEELLAISEAVEAGNFMNWFKP